MNNKRIRLLMLVTVMALALIIAGCSAPAAAPAAPAAEEGAAESETETESAQAASDRCGDASQLSDQLNFFNWADYIDEDILTQFEEECGIEVVMDNYTTNEELIAKIQAGNSGYDLVVPTDYAVSIMADQGLLAELDKTLIPNEANLSSDTMGMYYDPDNKYSLPYQWSTTGLAYNATSFPDGGPTSWAAVFDPEQVCEFKGFVSMLDDPRETIGKALMYLGYDINESDPAAQEEAKDLLLAQKDCIAGYNSENYIQNLASEEVIMAESWAFAAALARADNENIFYVIPEEGGTIWQDNLAVPADAPHAYTAHVFINYLLDPEIGAQLTEWTFGFTPNKAAESLLSDDYYALMGDGGMLPTEELFENLHWIERSPGTEIFNDTWTAVKAQ